MIFRMCQNAVMCRLPIANKLHGKVLHAITNKHRSVQESLNYSQREEVVDDRFVKDRFVNEADKSFHVVSVRFV